MSETGAEESLTFAQLARRSSQVANFLSAHGVGPGDRILIMLTNVVPLWETMLAAIKLGAVIIPATTLLERTELRDRLERGSVKVVVTTSNLVDRFEGLGTVVVRVAIGEAKDGWLPYEDSYTAHEHFAAIAPTRADDLLLLYFTSGTTAQPKLVAHTHASYPVGHLSTMYWLGLRPGDVHLNLSSPGWAKHAWSSFFAPWNAQACVLSLNYERFDARAVLDQMSRCGVTTFCAPPTVWRLLIQQNLASWHMTLREATSAGEPLNPEVIERVRAAWGITVRDGFGQTETTAQVGNPPGLRIKPGSMGKPLPGCPIVLVDLQGKVADEGEVCVDLATAAPRLDAGYFDAPERNSEAMADGYYHTGDIASRDAEGYLTYVGRMDDVFKSSGLPDKPLRARKRVDRARRGFRGSHRAGPGSRPTLCPKGLRRVDRGRYTGLADGAVDLSARPDAPVALQTHSPPRVRAAAEDDIRKNPSRGFAPGRSQAVPRSRRAMN